MTLSGNQWEQEKIIGLEKTLEEYKAMVEMLMEKDGADGIEKNRSELVLLRENYSQLKNKYMKLELELDRRSIRGDYDPTDTKVLHLRMNPLNSAVMKEARMKEELQKDNDALRARIQLLEEGQTKDLTMMVGHRLEEGVSSQEVQNLQEQLKSSDLKNQRIMEMFKKTSKEFREFVFQTTGYRIDKSGEDTYKVKSVYVDSPDSYLLFKLSEQAGLEMLESEFSLELEELMEQHLEQQNSFPMFLAGLTMQAYRKRQGTYCEEDEEEVDDHDEYEDDDAGEVDEEDEENDDDEEDDDGNNEIDDARSVDSGDSSDLICVEDD
ncbi:mitotic spindle assembly checkpoint protein MAD1-like [Eurytemora carolleeae]|uniref:mitotic spindle assembly checkpoint protein MAD1-like n=1 Tax=Eurytemora carolleeae TaxID=1294199 RepID=UPI000C765631|nr:mitotic spindle assembly checkpoint protein MAD1-like [Eurytemora carolleeae]|eukprot:XP_023338287.1 mitotic spindle assembly checkpoint protein MAD1-like [Eurytemora affinis]